MLDIESTVLMMSIGKSWTWPPRVSLNEKIF